MSMSFTGVSTRVFIGAGTRGSTRAYTTARANIFTRFEIYVFNARKQSAPDRVFTLSSSVWGLALTQNFGA